MLEEEVSKDSNNNAIEKKEEKVTFLKVFMASFVDGVIMFLISVFGVSILDFAMKNTIGYYVKDKPSMTLFIFLIVVILYPSILKGSKKGTTFGERSIKSKTK